MHKPHIKEIIAVVKILKEVSLYCGVLQPGRICTLAERFSLKMILWSAVGRFRVLQISTPTP